MTQLLGYPLFLRLSVRPDQDRGPKNTPGERHETGLQHPLHAGHLGIMEGAQQPAVPSHEYPWTRSPGKDQEGH